MTDIPKMLRAEALIADEDWTGIYGISPNLAYAAADRIEKLEAALREFATCDCSSNCDAKNGRVCELWACREALDAK